MQSSSCFERVVAIVNDRHVCFRFEDGCKADAPFETVNNSKLLREALSEDSDIWQVFLQVPKGVIQSWLQIQEQQQPFSIQFLQVRTD